MYYYSAGMGVLNAARQTMTRMLGNTESAFERAREQFWVIDALVGINYNFLFQEKFPSLCVLTTSRLQHKNLNCLI